jgi:capsular polysaccharide biosynthesis protein
MVAHLGDERVKRASAVFAWAPELELPSE